MEDYYVYHTYYRDIQQIKLLALDIIYHFQNRLIFQQGYVYNILMDIGLLK